MDSRLDINIGFVNTEFQAIDQSPYEEWEEDQEIHMVIQRLIFIGNNSDNTLKKYDVKIATNLQELKDPYIVENISNGLYYYQKILIPSEEHTTEANDKLYFDSSGIVHYKNADESIHLEFNPEDVNNFDDLYNIIKDTMAPDNCFYFDDYCFTIYDLVKCYVLAEQDQINNYIKNNCSTQCSVGSSEMISKADILLASVFVLRELIADKNYIEAQRILNRLNTCGNLCAEYAKKLKGCGCGRS